MEIKWKTGSQHKVDPEKAYTEVERIKAKNGGVVTAGLVVLEAQKKRNPLHKEFEWDDSIAAAEYRMEQARRMLRSFIVTYQESPHIESRAYEVVTEVGTRDESPRKVYKTTKEILQDPIQRDELLGRAINDALAFRRKYHELSELAQVFHEIDDLVVNMKI
jgi:hypothetical protein